MSAPKRIIRALAITPKGRALLARDKRARVARRESAQRRLFRRWDTGWLKDHAELVRLLRVA